VDWLVDSEDGGTLFLKCQHTNPPEYSGGAQKCRHKFKSDFAKN